MGLPLKTVDFNVESSSKFNYVVWDNILYRPELFEPAEHGHPDITQDVFNRLIQVVDTLPQTPQKGQLFFIRK